MFRFRNTDKNTVSEHKSNPKKTGRILITALLAVIFILGLGIILYKTGNKPVKKSETVAGASSEIPGWWTQQYFGSSVCNNDTCKPEADPDQDKLTNAQEFFYHTDPLNAFTSKDKLDDGQLVAAGFDPSRPGHMTYDEVTAPDNILGESLLVDQDIKQMVADDFDISKVVLPLVEDSEIQIITDPGESVYQNYANQLQSTVNKYFTAQSVDEVSAILKSSNGADLSSVMIKFSLLSKDLKKIAVPTNLVTFHKYLIAIYQLMPEVLTNDGAFDSNSNSSDAWFDKAQAFLAVYQKLNFEMQRLGIQTPI